MWYDNITLGQIVVFLASVAAVIGSVSAIVKVGMKFSQWRKNKHINPVLEEMAKMEKRIMDKMAENDAEINDKIDKLTQDVNGLDISQCKDVIISYISALEHNAQIDVAFEQRAYEAMERYTDVLHQNSYIHKRWVEVVENKKNKE